MKIAVYDTYVTRRDGRIMHFDILVPVELKDEARVHQYGKEYLEGKNEKGQPLTSRECNFCHIEQASPTIISDINRRGFSIIEMEGCS